MQTGFGWLQRVGVFLAFLVVSCGLAWQANAFHAEFGSSSDEPGHVVTGLMVRDYIASNFSEPAMTYARNYYNHYPKVAFGHWPPLFYVVQASWTLLFGASKITLMVLMAVLSSLCALTVTEVVTRESTRVFGVAAGMMLLLNPRWQLSANSVMAEVPAALLITWAILAFSEYLDHVQWKYSLLFGFLASLALLTKPTGIELALVPPFAVILTRRFRLFLKPSFWLPLVPIGLLSAPWYIWVPGSRHEKLEEFGGVYWNFNALNSHAVWAHMAGWIPCLAALLFVIVQLMKSASDKPQRALWVILPSLCLSTIVFRSIITAWAGRHLLHAVPFIIAAASVGLFRFCQWLKHRSPIAFQAGSLALVLLMVYAGFTFSIPHKVDLGFQRAADYFFTSSPVLGEGLLILSDGFGEGAFTSEIALRDTRPNRYVIRGSKFMSKEDWVGNVLEGEQIPGGSALQQQLELLPVSAVVVDMDPSVVSPSREVFFKLMGQNPGKWEKVKEFPRYFVRRPPSVIAIFRLAATDPRPLKNVPDQLGSY